ncbi:MAG: tRNA (adenosine(37)-N6)-dimethylallyltransferase MiaA [Thermoleophilia bacterium]
MGASPARVLAIFGPTAAGKSALAHAAAAALDGEIVVCDPFQRYRGLEIAADSPRPPELAEVPYHLVGDLELTQASSAADFAVRAHAAVDDILRRGRVPVVTGGTGLYLRAALADLEFPDPPDAATRDWAEALVAADPDAARDELRRLDPDACARVDTANPRRLVRALELARAGASGGGPRLWDGSMRRPTLLVAVTRPRERLHALIATRVRRELDEGLVAELERALDTPGVRREPLQIIGAAEVAGMRRGEVAPEALPELLCARTRRLARRQMQWLARWPEAVRLELDDAPPREALARLLNAWADARGVA